MKRTLAEDALLVEAGSLDVMDAKVKKHAETLARGASLERTVWMAFGRRLKRLWGAGNPRQLEVIESFLMFGNGRTKRNAKPGGLGKKTKEK